MSFDAIHFVGGLDRRSERKRNGAILVVYKALNEQQLTCMPSVAGSQIVHVQLINLELVHLKGKGHERVGNIETKLMLRRDFF